MEKLKLRKSSSHLNPIIGQVEDSNPGAKDGGTSSRPTK